MILMQQQTQIIIHRVVFGILRDFASCVANLVEALVVFDFGVTFETEEFDLVGLLFILRNE